MSDIKQRMRICFSCIFCSGFNISHNLLNCVALAKIRNAFYIFNNKIFRLFDFNCVVEKTVKLIFIIRKSSQLISLLESLTRKNAYNDVSSRQCRNSNVLNIVANDMVSDIFCGLLQHPYQYH